MGVVAIRSLDHGDEGAGFRSAPEATESAAPRGHAQQVAGDSPDPWRRSRAPRRNRVAVPDSEPDGDSEHVGLGTDRFRRTYTLSRHPEAAAEQHMPP